MRAVTYHRYGPPSSAAVETIEIPPVGAREVRLRVRAVALNPADWHHLTGLPYIARLGLGPFGPRRSIPGSDVAGVVDEVGDEVTKLRPGDAAFGFVGGGACAEAVSVPDDQLVSKPAGVSFEAAAATGVAAFTALQAVRDVAAIGEGDRVVVNGATGGVGHFAVQIAKSFGAEVTAVSSASNLDVARRLGADHVIDYGTEDFTAGSERYDAILDNPGNRPLRSCRNVLVADGTYVLVGGSKAPVFGPIPRLLRSVALGIVSSQKFALVSGTENADDLGVLRTMLEDSAITPLVSRVMHLDEVPAALDEIGRGHTLGKLVARP